MAGTAPAQVHPALLTAEDSGGSTTKPPQLLAFSFIPLFCFFRPASHQDTGLARPLRLFFFLHPHLTVWWLQAGAGAAWVAPGTVARSSRGWAWEGQGRTRGCRGCPGTHSNCPGVQILSRCPRAPPAIPCWGLRFREFALIHIYNIFLYVTSPPGNFSALNSSFKPSWKKRHLRGGVGVAVSLQRARAGAPSTPWRFHPFPRAPLSSQGKAGQLRKAPFPNIRGTAR